MIELEREEPRLAVWKDDEQESEEIIEWFPRIEFAEFGAVFCCSRKIELVRDRFNWQSSQSVSHPLRWA